MDSATRSSLHDLTLKAREELTSEIRSLLEGVYGILPSGKIEGSDGLPAVQESSEAQETRARLEQYLADEAEAGFGVAEAVNRLVKETAYTHLNRLVAFKMLEARGLVRGTIDRHHDSNGFMFYLAEHEGEQQRYSAGDLPKDSMGEGPRDAAYRRFLISRCGDLAEELRVLFESDDLASRLFPRPRVLKDLVDLLNDRQVSEAWDPGNEETLGWVYQYFNEREKDEVFERLYKKKQKIRASDVPAATQLFTPRWIVRNLVHNTLGRLWTEMHPDTSLLDSGEALDYLIPLSDDVPGSEMKLVREISVLDPACGTMHFGLVAFDLLSEMYREELRRASEPGWPDEPSVTDEAEIPVAILRDNLFGMDIDPRAVQLSALTLYLKAKSLNSKAALTEINLACSATRPPDHLDSFLEESELDPIHERIVRATIQRMGSASAGSLVRVEEEIRALIARERARYEREGRQLDLQGASQAEYGEAVPDEAFWGGLFDRIRDALDEFEAQHGHDESYFVGETKRGLRVLDLVLRRYDAVVANPPYLSRRNANKELADFLAAAYPEGKGDLYTAFIQRCAELLDEGGRLGMISQQSFMFISSYEKLRAALLEEHAIETVTHVGSRAFAEIGGEKVNTVLFTLHREGEERQGDAAVGTYLRLVREPDAVAKRKGFERALTNLNAGEDASAVFHTRQGDLKAIPGAPWVYWITPGLRRLFTTLPKLSDTSPPRVGLQTGQNTRFLRFWWEVGDEGVAHGYTNAWEARETERRWFPYMKGGSFRRWWGNQELVVNWEHNGEEMKAFDPAVIRNPSFYFQRGVTWTDLASGQFNARLSPGGFIFDVSGSSVFPEDALLVMAVMNSTLSQHLLKQLNPTMHVQVGDLSRLPLPTQSSNTLHQLVEEAVELAQADSAEDETTYDFVAPPDWRGVQEAVRRRGERLAEVESEIDEEVYRLYRISAEDRAAIEAELAEPTVEGVEPEEGAPGRKELAECWISYAVGTVLGRFGPGTEGAIGGGDFSRETTVELAKLVDPDGVTTLEEGHPDDLAEKVERALELMVGEEEVRPLLEAASAEGDRAGLRRYLSRDFFKRHVRLYRKRPVYWLLQSPGKSYGIYLFHERATRDTLYLLDSNRYLGGRINGSRQNIEALNGRAAAAEGQEKRRLEKEREAEEEFLADLEAFRRELQRVTSLQNERGETAGWEPEPDDGVLINLAPIYSLMPSWSTDPKKAWEPLSAGEYDWSHTAMRYWPDRVLEACRKNKSYAIAHGRLDVYAGGE